MKTYYFISYRWQRDGMTYWNFGHDVTDIHPINWIRDSPGPTENYAIVFYAEISKEKYEEFEGDW